MKQTDVLIVGAGPVGLTLAIDLGKRGVKCTLIEQKDAPQFLPKMERANARTMEMFRRIGLADTIRKAGLRGDCPMDVYVVLSMNQPPLLRHRRHQSRRDNNNRHRRHHRRQPQVWPMLYCLLYLNIHHRRRRARTLKR